MKKQSKAGFSLIELSIVILIIGVLIAGVTQASRLVASFKLSTARTLTQSSPVAGIKDLAAWWETTSEKSFAETETEDGSSVSTWYNINPQISLNQDAAQSDAEKKPTYARNAINGLPALHFDGSTQYLTSPYSKNINADNMTVFMVVQAPRDSDGAIFLSYDNTLNDGYGSYVSPGNEYDLYGYDNTSFTRADSSPLILTAIVSRTSLKWYNNGNYTGEASASELSNEDGDLAIGAQTFDMSYFYKGHIGELIFFNRALTAEEQKSVEKYLIQKWNIDTTLEAVS